MSMISHIKNLRQTLRRVFDKTLKIGQDFCTLNEKWLIPGAL